MKSILFYIILFLSSFSLSAQIRIAGSIDAFTNTGISLLKYNDLLSKTTTVISKDTIDSNGFFVISTNHELIGEYILKIENRSISIILEPNSQYEVKLYAPPNLNNQISQIRIEYVAISSQRQIQLAEEILAFDEIINSFLYKNDHLIGKKTFTPKVDSLYTHIAKEFENSIETWEYFDNYQKYQAALLYLLANRGDHFLFNKYIKELPIRYNNKLQSLFIKSFYNTNFERLKLNLGHEYDSIFTIDTLRTFLINELKKTPRLKEDRYAEFILLSTIKKSNRTNTIPYQSGNRLLKDIMFNSPFDEHKYIAENLLKKRKNLKPGSKVPDLLLVDKKERSIYFNEEFQNRFIYLGFFASWNRASHLDLKIIKQIKKEFGRNISFVNVSMDRSFSDYVNFINQNDFSWDVYHFANNYGIYEDFEIKSLPIYFLIAPDGTLLKSPAERPEISIKLFKKIKELSSKGLKPYEIIRSYDE